MSDSDSILLEAYQRFHETGPEWGGHGLSNHGPMAVEAMVRRGYADSVRRWVDNYTRRLVEPPRGLATVTEDDWREALGDITRVADWTAFFHRQLAERPWREVVTRWWPRLLPGIAGGATHGVIRVGHVVHSLTLAEAESGSPTEPAGHVDDNPLLVELFDALGYWAACWRPVHGDPSHRSGSLTAADALAAVPPVAEQSRGVPYRIAQLPTTEGWQPALDGLRSVDDPEQVPTLLTQVIDATVVDYLPRGHGQPVMRVHASTAPAAVLRVLPVLPRELWVPSMDLAWQAAAALRAACLPPAADPADLVAHVKGVTTPEDAMARAVEHGDEHVIKFVDIAMDTFTRTGDPDALAASSRCVELVTHVETAGRSKFDGRGSSS
ncbi:questin oxidase family protein [Micromonospora sp. NBS 11-29]|uniref:questin oxidase family protein n=1 Tax=Micromonospora sp. NBS 11-29 TaxID=1960879 RepID=UPI0015934D5E|nr:questin oxidase family protein [Micromonospora sp. NBS 11-29]